MCCRIKSFCCFDLPTAVVILGYFGLASSLGFVIGEMLLIQNIGKFSWSVIIAGIYFSTDQISPTVWSGVLGTHLSMNLVDLIASSFLLLGAFKKNPLMLVPWLVRSMIGNIIACVAFATVNVFVASVFFPGIVFSLIISFALLGFWFYCWSAVKSLFDQMRDRDEYLNRLA